MNRDFSSALYLGMQHCHEELQSWDSLTTGVPAALFEAPDAIELGKSVAGLQGMANGIVAASTFHLFWDWFGGLEPDKDIVFADVQLYQVGTWGVERAAGKGVKVIKFPHQCPGALQQHINLCLRSGKRPIVVTDGWCPFCGKVSPLSDYLEIIKPFGGLLVLDDTQALGILGQMPNFDMPFGYTGGGSCRFLAIERDQVLTISSLAKAFGSPLAALCGSESEVRRFRIRSETRVSSSPPSAVALAAGLNALQMNSSIGRFRRARLLQNVNYFKQCMAKFGFETIGGFFPVQTIKGLDQKQTRQLYVKLRKKGFRTVPVLVHGKSARLCWMLNASHSEKDIETACKVFWGLIQNTPILKSYHHENVPRRDFSSGIIR